MSSMSFHEKSAWVTLISLLIIGALYFSTTWSLWQIDGLHMVSLLGLATGFSILLVLMLAGFHLIMAAIAGARGEGGRDRLITWRSGHISGIVLAVAVVAIVLMVIGGGMVDQSAWQEPVVIANALIGAVFASTVCELALTIWLHRRGA